MAAVTAGVASPETGSLSMRFAVRTMSLPRGSSAELSALQSVLTVARLAMLSAMEAAAASSCGPELASYSDSASVSSLVPAGVACVAWPWSSRSLLSRVGLSAEGTKSTLPATALRLALIERVARDRRTAEELASLGPEGDCVEAARSAWCASGRLGSLLLTLDRDRDGDCEWSGEEDACDLLRCERGLRCEK